MEIPKKKPLTEIVIRNTSSYRPLVLRRAKSKNDWILNPLSGLGVRVYKDNPFIGFNSETGVITIDVGDED